MPELSIQKCVNGKIETCKPGFVLNELLQICETTVKCKVDQYQNIDSCVDCGGLNLICNGTTEFVNCSTDNKLNAVECKDNKVVLCK